MLKVKSIITKLFLVYFIFAALGGGIVFALWHQGIFADVNVYYLIGGIAAFTLVFALFCLFWFVAKPLRTILSQVQLVLLGRPFKKIYTTRVDEVGVLAHFFNQVTEGFTQVASDIKDRRRILDELAVAAELQKRLFPKNQPQVDGLNIVIRNRPATEIGGDSFDIVDSKNNLYMYIGDVTGHGMTAGLVMAMVNSMIRSFSDVYGTALEIVVAANKYIKRYVETSMFMTLVMLSWDKVNKKMTYVGAGHEKILIYRKATESTEEITSGGTALGMLPDISKTAKEIEIPLNTGDVIVLYSDGITETKGANGELFGVDRLKSCVTEYARQYAADGISHHISQEVSTFAGDESQLDDMTLIVIEKK